MSNVNAVLKALDKGIDETIKSSKDHGKLLTKWTIAAFLFAAEHGQTGPMTRLYKGVNATDQEGIRLFVANSIRVYGKPAKGDANERPISFLTYSKETGFALADYSTADNGENKIAAAKAMKTAVIKAGEVEIASKVPLGKMGGNADEQAMAMFNTVKRVGDFIKLLARNGEKALALQINRAVGEEYAVPVGTIDTLDKDNNPETKLAAAKKRVADLEKQIEAKASAHHVAANDANVKAERAASVN